MNKKNMLGNPQHYGVWVGEFLNVTFNDNPPNLSWKQERAYSGIYVSITQ